MSFLLKRRLKSTADQLQRAREDLAVTNEQLEQLADEADSAGLRSLVSDDPSAAGEFSDAERHAAALARHRQSVVERIAMLEARSDELLDKLSQAGRT